MTSSAVSPAPTEAPDQADAARDAECRAFCRYLLGRAPDAYITGWYRRGHAGMPCHNGAGYDRFDQLLVRFARGGPIAAKVADAYARRFRPFGVLRQKLVLLLAILEHAPSTGSGLTEGWTGGRSAFLLALSGAALGSAIALVGGIVLLGPVHLILGGRPRAPAAR